jgi:translation initiation factor IF-2
MAEATKQIKLMAAAKEFNVGTATLVDFLSKKGFTIKNSPMEKLSEDMVEAITLEYAPDKRAKQNSENVLLGHKPKKVEEAPVVAAPAPPPPPPPPPVVEPEPEPIVEVVPEPEPIIEEIIEAPKPAKKSTKKVVEEAPVEEVPELFKEEVLESGNVEKTKLDGPNVVGKIDLSEVGKPKRGAKKKEDEAPAAPVKPAAKKVVKAEPKVEAPPSKRLDIALDKFVTKAPAPKEKEAEVAAVAPIIENVVERKQLEGIKVMGKMVLPLPVTRTSNNPNEKRKRKRIAVDKNGIAIDNNRPAGTGAGSGRSGTGTNTYNRGPNQGGGGFRKPNEERVIDKTEIQDKIKQTLAKLGGGNRGKTNKSSKYRKDKRDSHAQKNEANQNQGDDTVLKLTEFISVNELATLMDVSFAEVIGTCMNLGTMVSINQRLDAEVIELVASEFGFTVEFINLEQEAENDNEEEVEAEENLLPRPPIVTIMGHVDHGKTSLLDYIRKENVIAGEAGGITQHIGAYEVTLPSGKQIAFLDTPGHEAFTAMRARGAKVTDLAVIVVAADDAVMPQTKEAISHAQAAGVPMIFAINKMDKDGANPEKIYEQLSGMNILVEAWGGKFQSQPIAAKSGMNVDVLLEKILLEAEMLNLRANPNRTAIGSVIEASLDKGRGYVATVLVQTGTMRVGDMIVAGSIYGRVRAMYNERGGKMDTAGPSTPVQILGLNGAPQAGEKFKVYADENEAKEVANHRSQILREQGMRTRKHITLDEIGRRLALGNFKQLNVIIKGDVDGSVEALSDSLQKLSTAEVAVSVVHKAVGQITESDVLLATASDAIILGFQVRPSSQAANLASNENIEIRFYSVIYDAIDEIRNAMEGLLEPKIEQKRTCNIEVREVFKITGVGAIAGCLVLDGKIQRSHKVNLIRDGIVVFTGELASLKRYKDDVKEVQSGTECGLSIKNYLDIREGDIIEGFEEIEVKRTL